MRITWITVPNPGSIMCNSVLDSQHDVLIRTPARSARWDDAHKAVIWPTVEFGAVERWVREHESVRGAAKMVKLGRQRHLIKTLKPHPLRHWSTVKVVVDEIVGITREAQLDTDMAFAFKIKFG